MRGRVEAGVQPARARPADEGRVWHCSGDWRLGGIAELERRLPELCGAGAGPVELDFARVRAMDTAGAWLLARTVAQLTAAGRPVELSNLLPAHAELLALVRGQETAPGAGARRRRAGLLARVGRETVGHLIKAVRFVAFVGEMASVLLGSLLRPRSIRWRAFWSNVQVAGFNALPIIGLLSFLTGVVIAYQGSVQLRQFGANIFVVDLVGLTMVRELSPLLVAIIVAGRTGSAYTAQIGTMKMTGEVDALITIGIPPMELLVLPKVFALLLALPLLTVFGDILGVLGGMVMAKATLAVTARNFLDRFQDAVSLTSLLTGLGKTPVFAAIIALVGCYQGMQAGGGPESVGAQTTTSVVKSIFFIIVADAGFSVLFSWLNL